MNSNARRSPYALAAMAKFTPEQNAMADRGAARKGAPLAPVVWVNNLGPEAHAAALRGAARKAAALAAAKAA